MTRETRPLTSHDLRAFDDRARRLVARMIRHGWRGRLTSNGHVVMRAPDGKTTQTLSRDSGRGRSGANMEARFEGWLRRGTSD